MKDRPTVGGGLSLSVAGGTVEVAVEAGTGLGTVRHLGDVDLSVEVERWIDLRAREIQSATPT